MQFTDIILLTNLVTLFQDIFAGMNSTALEILKIVFVSFAWIGGLGLFMWRRERKLQLARV